MNRQRRNYSAAGFTAGLLAWFGMMFTGVLLAETIGGTRSTAGAVVFLLFFIGAFAAMIYVWRRWGLREAPPLTAPRPSRPPIPQQVKEAVWRRDGGSCVYCSSTQNLEFDHIIPYSKGGADTVGNLQVLCRGCNRSKGSNI